MLTIEKLRVEYPTAEGSHLAVDNISLSVEEGEFFTFLGPSGCGKTTTLRSTAGLETPTSGRISIGNDRVFDSEAGRVEPTHRRDISMVFQSYAIWPNMTVAENVAFPLEVKRMSRSEVASEVKRTLEMVGLGSYADRPATALSGGQQQRVALARAVIKNAKLLLLDEPLSNLDAKLREQMRHELRDLQRRVGTTTIYVTHDQEEALSLSDRIAVMNGGKLIEIGTPLELYLRPHHAFTARFMGEADLTACQPQGEAGQGLRVSTAYGEVVAEGNAGECEAPTHLLIRPEHIRFLNGDRPELNVVSGKIAKAVFSGKQVEYEVETDAGDRLSVQSSSAELRKVGDSVALYLPPEHCVLLTDDP